jgi:prepilin-type N-terminal cleavage/methylation domain-containing protein
MKKAFTLIELLIALGLSSMVFMLVSTLLVTVLNSNTRDSRRDVFEQTKNDITVGVSNEVRWAEKISYTPGNQGELDINDGQIVYKLDTNGILTKNGTAIIPETIKVTKFTVENLSNNSDTVSLNINVEMENRKLPSSKDRVKIVVSQRQTTQEAAK